MSRVTWAVKRGLVLAACGAISACGSGGDGQARGPVVTPPVAAAPSGVAAVGTVTGFGSVYVSGVRYEVVPTTLVSVDGQDDVLGDDSGLKLGMKVTVVAEDMQGARTARLIDYDDDLRGVVESVLVDPENPALGTLVVSGILVTVDADTVYDDDVGENDGEAGTSLADVLPGMVVEVSGFPTDTGFLATRIDRDVDDNGDDESLGDPDVDDDELEIEGFVNDVAADGTSIVVGATSFTVAASTELDEGLLINSDLIGSYVEVEADIVNGEFVATSIEREDDFDNDDDGDDDYEVEFEIEGVLQAIDTSVSPSTIQIDGLTIPVADATPLAGLIGEQVEIDGRFNAEGVLVLERASRDRDSDIEVYDLVASVDETSGSFTTRLGIEIVPTGVSSVEDDAADDDDDENLTPAAFINRLQIGDRVEARGYSEADGAVTWMDIEREEIAAENDDFACELRGPVDDVSGDAASFTFTIQGVTVLTDRMDDDDFEDDDNVNGRAEFFERLSAGEIVEAESFPGDANCMAGQLDAAEVEFEDDDDD